MRLPYFKDTSNAQEEGIDEEVRQLLNIQLQEFIGEKMHMLRAKLKPIHERPDRVEVGTSR